MFLSVLIRCVTARPQAAEGPRSENSTGRSGRETNGLWGVQTSLISEASMPPLPLCLLTHFHISQVLKDMKYSVVK